MRAECVSRIAMPNEISHTGDGQRMENTLISNTNQKTGKMPLKYDEIGSLPTDNYIRYNMSRNGHGMASKNHSFGGLENVFPDSNSTKIGRSHSNKARYCKVTANDGSLTTRVCDSFCDNLNLRKGHRSAPLNKCIRDQTANPLAVHVTKNTPSSTGVQCDKNRNKERDEIVCKQNSHRKHTMAHTMDNQFKQDVTVNNNTEQTKNQDEASATASDSGLAMSKQHVIDGAATQHDLRSLKSPTSSSASMVSIDETRPSTRQKTFRMDSVEMIESLLGASVVFENRYKPRQLRISNPFPSVGKTFIRKKRNSQPVTNNRLEDYRLVVLGSGGVGKSSLVEQFLHGCFSCHYTPTVEESYRHLVQLPDGVFHTIEILDTAGLHQFPAMRRLSIISGDAFIVVFSLNNRESFTEALQLVQLISETKGAKCKTRVPIILVGNKCDLEDNKEVTAEEALTASLEHNLYAYIQTSAKDNENVQKLFSELMLQIFGVHERLQEAEAKRGSGFKNLSRQLSERVRKLSQTVRRHHSDTGDYRSCALQSGNKLDISEPVKNAENNSVATTSSENRGCVFGKPACCIL